MKLRPHHLVDILSDHGLGVEYTPHPYGHALHSVAAQVLNDPAVEIEFVLAADDICAPCRHLQPDGNCDDILSQPEVPLSKQAYNDRLDSKLFPYLGMKPGVRMKRGEFLARVNRHLPGIEKLCTHPGEIEVEKLHGLRDGLLKLGVKPNLLG